MTWRLLSALLLFLSVAACDSGSNDPDPVAPSGPNGSFGIQEVSFRLFRVVDQARGITEDLQGTITGSVSVAVSGESISGSGTCSWTSRRYIARTAQEERASGSQAFSLTGTVNGDDIRVLLQGCVWNQVGYRGGFDGTQYTFRLQDPIDAPIFGPDVWQSSEVIDGDPLGLVFLRR